MVDSHLGFEHMSKIYFTYLVKGLLGTVATVIISSCTDHTSDSDPTHADNKTKLFNVQLPNGQSTTVHSEWSVSHTSFLYLSSHLYVNTI